MLTKEQALIELAKHAKSVNLPPSKVVHRFLGAAFSSTPANPTQCLNEWIAEINKNIDAPKSFWMPSLICETWNEQRFYVANIVKEANAAKS